MLDLMLGGYTVLELSWYFLLASVAGWVLEVAYRGRRARRFVNPGFLIGPYCPIYGFGVVWILLATSAAGMRDLAYAPSDLLRLFVLVTLLATVLEFSVGAGLMLFFRQRWWDYSHLRFNIAGYVSLRFSLYWGLGGTAFYLLLDLLHLNEGLVLPRPLFDWLSVLVLAVLVADVTRSVDLAIRLRVFASELAEAARELRERIEAAKDAELDFLRIEAEIRRGRLDEFLREAQARLSRLDENRRHLLRLAMTRYDVLLSGRRIRQFGHIVRAFPGIRDIRYASALEAVKERLTLPRVMQRTQQSVREEDEDKKTAGPDDGTASDR